MICRLCDDKGIVLICYRHERTYDAAACLCNKGQYWRTKHQLKAWASMRQPKPDRIGGLEDFYEPQAIEELRTLPAADLDQDVGGIPQAAEWEQVSAGQRTAEGRS